MVLHEGPFSRGFRRAQKASQGLTFPEHFSAFVNFYHPAYGHEKLMSVLFCDDEVMFDPFDLVWENLVGVAADFVMIIDLMGDSSLVLSDYIVKHFGDSIHLGRERIELAVHVASHGKNE